MTSAPPAGVTTAATASASSGPSTWEAGPSEVGAPRAPRLGVLATHPIQYQAPLYREITRGGRVRLDVAFLSQSAARYQDRGFRMEIAWDVDVLGGYRHRFLGDPADGRLAEVHRARRLLAWIHQQDAVVVHGHAQAWMLTAAAAARVLGRPYLLRGESRPHSAAVGWRTTGRDLVAGLAVRHAAAGLTIGEHNRAFYRRFGAARQFFAPYSVDNDRFAAGAAAARGTRSARLAELGLPADRPVVVFAGKLREVKRPIDAIAAVRALGGAVALLVIGDGSLRDEVERACSGLPATCVGFVNQAALPAYYALGDVFVLPSRTEPWGLVVNEAMACGLLPVVSDSVGCGPDLVHGLGRIFRTGDVDDLAANLRLAVADLTDPELPARIAERAGRYCLARTARGFEDAALAVTQDLAAVRGSRRRP